MIRALWVGDTYSLLVESGFANVDLPNAYDAPMMATDRKRFGPAFYRLQMLHIVAHAPADTLVDAKSTTVDVLVHATRRQDGIAGVMLINTSQRSPATGKLSFRGGTVGATGRRFDYGTKQLEQNAGPAATPLEGAGNEFTVTIPPLHHHGYSPPLTK